MNRREVSLVRNRFGWLGTRPAPVIVFIPTFGLEIRAAAIRADDPMTSSPPTMPIIGAPFPLPVAVALPL